MIVNKRSFLTINPRPQRQHEAIRHPHQSLIGTC